MATQAGRFPMLNVCLYFKFGYCKHKEHCRKQHIKELCEKTSCDISNCTLRHPKICKFHRDHGMCKFNPCMFRHVENDFDEMKKENDKLLKMITNIDNKLKDLEMKIVESEALSSKLSIVEERLEKLDETAKKVCEKDCLIESLAKKVDAMEAIQHQKDEIIKNLEERIQKTEVFIHEKSNNKNKSKDKVKCQECDFEAISQHGLKVHMKRKHTLTGTEQYPRICEICEIQFESQSDMKYHMRSHGYKKTNFQCLDCEFLGNSRRTMNVHIGKHHSENFECGLCESVFKSLDNLELHIFTCETFTCRKCEFKAKTLGDIKSHILDTHEYGGFFLHLKMNRENYNEVDDNDHWVTAKSEEE